MLTSQGAKYTCATATLGAKEIQRQLAQWLENLVFLCFAECSSLRLQRIKRELVTQTRTIVYPQFPVDSLQLTSLLQHVYAV